MTTTDAALRQKVAERIRNYGHLVKKMCIASIFI